MNEKQRFKIRKLLLLSAKIGIGASVAIYIAQLLNLEYATSAGIITLLTLITTKWETLKLSLLRLVTYAISVAFCWVIFHFIPNKQLLTYSDRNIILFPIWCFTG